mmetsp:Transcript_2717/g.7570  ORF Transcript_2717/g.7570 Transcript_2717/m.7570 type:complete len:408 (-) Transcript_2717:111-1334(-)
MDLSISAIAFFIFPCTFARSKPRNTTSPCGYSIRIRTMKLAFGIVVEKLVTHEDPNHFHKFFGVLVLLNFIIRFSMFGEADMGFKSHPEWTLPSLGMHTMLSYSSLIFKLPRRRIKAKPGQAGGYRIWPEYRLHSIIFASRSLLFLLLIFYEQQNGLQDKPLFWASGMIYYAALIAADVASWSVGREYKSPTVRGWGLPPIISFLFSAAQLSVYPLGFGVGPRRFGQVYIDLFIIQLNAFMMTLRRKNLAGDVGLLTLYGMMLGIGGFFAFFETSYYTPRSSGSIAGIFVCLAILLRLGPRVIPGLTIIQNSKYIMWGLLATGIHFCRPDYISDKLPECIDDSEMLDTVGTVLGVSVVALAACKHFRPSKRGSEGEVQKGDASVSDGTVAPNGLAAEVTIKKDSKRR